MESATVSASVIARSATLLMSLSMTIKSFCTQTVPDANLGGLTLREIRPKNAETRMNSGFQQNRGDWI